MGTVFPNARYGRRQNDARPCAPRHPVVSRYPPSRFVTGPPGMSDSLSTTLPTASMVLAIAAMLNGPVAQLSPICAARNGVLAPASLGRRGGGRRSPTAAAHRRRWFVASRHPSPRQRQPGAGPRSSWSYARRHRRTGRSTNGFTAKGWARPSEPTSARARISATIGHHARAVRLPLPGAPRRRRRARAPAATTASRDGRRQ